MYKSGCTVRPVCPTWLEYFRQPLSTTGRLAENAAIVAAGRVLLVLTTDGNLLVVAADRGGYRELAKYQVSESATWAHPALVGSKLLVKNREHLLVFDLKR